MTWVGETFQYCYEHQKKHFPGTDKRPAAVFFFGGGWVGGSPRQFYPKCHLLAERGMVAISAEYRTKKSHGTDPRACVEDGKSAARWIHEHAAELGMIQHGIASKILKDQAERIRQLKQDDISACFEIEVEDISGQTTSSTAKSETTQDTANAQADALRSEVEKLQDELQRLKRES